jgi:hypothetical protein
MKDVKDKTSRNKAIHEARLQRRGTIRPYQRVKRRQNVPSGRYSAVINEIVLQEANARGQSVRAKFHLAVADEDYHDNAPIVTWYKIFRRLGANRRLERPEFQNCPGQARL